MRLSRLRRNVSGEFEMFFNGSLTPEYADSVVLTIPFSVLRTIELDKSLGLSEDKKRAINSFGYGQNTKNMVAFYHQPWKSAGGNGDVYSDLPNLQNTWETNYSQAVTSSVITNFSGGNLAKKLQFMTDNNSGNSSACG